MIKSLKIRSLLKNAQTLESNGELEKAFEQYQFAAELGSSAAMFKIAMLYLTKQFRQVKQSNFSQLMLSGRPIFPWNIKEELVPDYTQAIQWLRQADEAGNGEASFMLGVMLCEGSVCERDMQKGVACLEKAVSKGIVSAKQPLYLYKTYDGPELSDMEYTQTLQAFEKALRIGSANSTELYYHLKGGTASQLSRLAYVLTVAKNNGVAQSEIFPFAVRDNGIPYFPAAPKRGSWETFVRIDLDAFSQRETWIAVSVDFGVDYAMQELHKLRFIGTAEYRSPEFGWLGEEKHANLYRIDAEAQLSEKELERVVQRFNLIPEEYEGNAAFFVENGEKEYSVEIAAITGKIVEVLYRYTIGGSSKVRNYFEPQLIKLETLL